MPEVGVPEIGNRSGDDEKPTPLSAPPVHFAGGKSLFRIVLEVALIGLGVFLGLMGEQWRERSEHRELAEESLRRFQAEIRTNRAQVVALKDYHADMKKRIDAYFALDASKRTSFDIALRGIQPASFEHTAWDLAMATQALSYMDTHLAFALSRIYGVQQDYSVLSRGVLQAMYLRPPAQDLGAFLQTVALYYSDVVLLEPRLIAMYDEILPQVDRALGTSGSAAGQ
jgi:hypothetical protein